MAYVFTLVLASVMAMAAPAAAADDGSSASSTLWRWMDVTDSHGNSAWGYSMSLDYGGVTDPGNALFGGITALCWFIYQWFAIVSIWLINFALSMDWFEPLETPATNIAASLHSILGSVGLPTMLLTLTAVAAGVWLIRGTIALAVFEVLVALVILTLGTGVLANPVDKAFGNDGETDKVVAAAGSNGWLAQASAAGLTVAGGIQNDTAPNQSPDQVRQDISEQLTDTFLRTPHQMINYGTILDGTGCEDAYDQSLNIGPRPSIPDNIWGGESAGDGGLSIDPDKIPEQGEPGWAEYNTFINWYLTVTKDDVTREELESSEKDVYLDPLNREELTPRDVVADCSEAAGERAENPSPGMAGDAATAGIGVMGLLALSLVLAGSLIYFGIEFLWCSIRLIWDLIAGLAPSTARTGLWQTIATAIWCLIFTFVTSIVLVTYLLVLTKVAQSFDGDQIMAAFVTLDVLFFAGVVLFWRLRKRMRRAAERTAQLLAKRPGKKPQRMTSRGLSTGQVAAGYLGARTAARAGIGATKLGLKAGKTAGKVGLVGGAVAGVATGVGGYKLAAGAGRRAKGALGRLGGGDQATTVADGAHKAARPHGSREGFADRRGLPGRPGEGRRKRPSAPTRPRTPFRPQQSNKRATLAKRFVHARASQPVRPRPDGMTAPAGFHRPRGIIRYERIIQNGQVIHVPVRDDEPDDGD